MASKKHLVILNGSPIKYEGDYLIEVYENGKTYYTTRTSGEDLKEVLDKEIEKRVNEEQHDPLNEAVEVRATGNTYNEHLKLHIFTTPLYQMKVNLALDVKRRNTVGRVTQIDVEGLWEKARRDFLVEGFINYAYLMGRLEKEIEYLTVRRNTPLKPKYKKNNKTHRVMTLFHGHIKGIFNPYAAIEGLKDFEIFKYMFDVEYSPLPESWKVPMLFRSEVMADYPIVMGTASDIYTFLGIKSKHTISSENLHRLLAGMVLKVLFTDLISKTKDLKILELPTDVILYQVIDSRTGFPLEGNQFFTDSMRASAEASRDSNYQVVTYDTVSMFVDSAFSNLTTTDRDELIKQIRGANFV